MNEEPIFGGEAIEKKDEATESVEKCQVPHFSVALYDAAVNRLDVRQ
jgi:hypothetical protein